MNPGKNPPLKKPSQTAPTFFCVQNLQVRQYCPRWRKEFLGVNLILETFYDINLDEKFKDFKLGAKSIQLFFSSVMRAVPQSVTDHSRPPAGATCHPPWCPTLQVVASPPGQRVWRTAVCRHPQRPPAGPSVSSVPFHGGRVCSDKKKIKVHPEKTVQNLQKS